MLFNIIFFLGVWFLLFCFFAFFLFWFFYVFCVVFWWWGFFWVFSFSYVLFVLDWFFIVLLLFFLEVSVFFCYHRGRCSLSFWGFCFLCIGSFCFSCMRSLALLMIAGELFCGGFVLGCICFIIWLIVSFLFCSFLYLLLILFSRSRDM